MDRVSQNGGAALMTKTPGLWTSRKKFDGLDGRTRIAKAFRSVKKELTTALGGDVSPQQTILIDRVVFLLFRVQTYEATILAGGPESVAVSSFYLAWVGSLRRVLETLGLERKARDLDLDQLLKESHDENATA